MWRLGLTLAAASAIICGAVGTDSRNEVARRAATPYMYHSSLVDSNEWKDIDERMAVAYNNLLKYEDFEPEDDPNDPCHPRNCKATFENSFSVPVTLPCSEASGEIPRSPKLPLVFPGDYDQCQRVFGNSGSHFCTIETSEFLGLPLRNGSFRYTGEGLALGRLYLGKCVAKSCSARALRRWFLKKTKTISRLLQLQMPLNFAIPFVRDMIENSTVVRCVDEDEAKRGSVWDHQDSAAMVIICIIIVLTVLISTAYDKYMADSKNGKIKNIWTSASLIQNYGSLIAPMSGDFQALNGIRVFSMIWILFGHVVLFSSGLALPFPIVNPSAIDRQVLSPYMAFSRGANYSVDSFFFMSGFLGVWGVLKDEKKRVEIVNWSIFVRNLLMRYMRLTPVYAFTLFFYMKLFPFTGTGPFYDAVQGVDYRKEECKYWWVNLLYLNNIIPFSEKGGLRGCAGWSWFLANDMQFFILILPSVWIFRYFERLYSGTKSGNLFSDHVLRLCAQYAVPAVLVVIQIAITYWTVNKWNIRGSFDDNFNTYLYVTPWCRVSSFAIGMAFAFWHFSRKSSLQDEWRGRVFWGIPPFVVVVLALVVLLTIVFSTYDQFRCKAADSNDCHIYNAFTIYGIAIAPNWSVTQSNIFFMFAYSSWAIAFGFICMYFFAGYGGTLNTILSHQWFTPLARLTYNVYLTHIPVIQYLYLTSPAPHVVSRKGHLVDTVGVFLISYIVAVILYLFVERPAMNIISALLHRSKRHSENIVQTELSVDDETQYVHNQEVQNIRQPLLGVN